MTPERIKELKNCYESGLGGNLKHDEFRELLEAYQSVATLEAENARLTAENALLKAELPDSETGLMPPTKDKRGCCFCEDSDAKVSALEARLKEAERLLRGVNDYIDDYCNEEAIVVEARAFLASGGPTT